MAFIGSSTTPANFSQLQAGIQVTGDDITDGNSNVIFDQTNNQVPLSILENNKVTISGGDGFKAAGDVKLGNSLTLDINVTDFAGTYLSGDGADNLQVNLGNGIVPDANNPDQISFDESISYTFTSGQTFNGGITLGADLDASNSIIKNLPEPSNVGDAARKGYVDGVAQGLDIKESVKAASDGTDVDLDNTTSVTSLDGVALATDDRVLLKDQNADSENGIYVVGNTSDTTTWTRSADFDDDVDVTSGAFTFVKEGNNLGSSSFTVISSDPITVDTDPIIFDQFASAGEIIGGNGINKSGRELSIATGDVITENDGITNDVNGNIQVKSDSTLTIDGSGNLTIDTSNTLTFSSVQNFNAGLDVSADITDGTDTIYDSSAGEIPDAILGTIENSTLNNTDITVNANNGISGGGTATLGDINTNGIDLSVAPGDFIDTTQLSIDGSGNISIDDIFLSNGGDRVSGAFTFGDFFDLEPITAPSSPATGDMRVFIDSNDNNLKAKADDGSIVTLVST